MNKIDIKDLHAITKDLSVLYVEDDLVLNKTISEMLQDLFCEVHTAFDGEDALKIYQNFKNTNNKYFDLIISDIKMPKMDGLTLTKEIYKINSEQTVIIVSAQNETNYLVELINIGVERFLQKPFKGSDLIDTLYYCTLKKEQEAGNKISLTKNLIWDNETNILTNEEQKVSLTKKEIILLKIFIKNKAKISTTQELFNALWQDDITQASSDSLKMHISRLRKKLDGVELETLYNLGYRLNF